MPLWWWSQTVTTPRAGRSAKKVEEMKRDIKVGIKSDDEFFPEAREIARQLDTGWRPELPIERLYF